MCAGGPPNPVTPMRVHSRATVASGAAGGSGRSCAASVTAFLDVRRSRAHASERERPVVKNLELREAPPRARCTSSEDLGGRHDRRAARTPRTATGRRRTAAAHRWRRSRAASARGARRGTTRRWTAAAVAATRAARSGRRGCARARARDGRDASPRRAAEARIRRRLRVAARAGPRAAERRPRARRPPGARPAWRSVRPGVRLAGRRPPTRRPGIGLILRLRNGRPRSTPEQRATRATEQSECPHARES